VLLTPRKRRRILKAVLPFLVVVWGALPWLPCCQEVTAAEPVHHSGAGAAHGPHEVEHASHGGTALGDRGPASAASDEPQLAADPNTDPSAPQCADVEKNHHETRVAASGDVAPMGPALILPIPASLIESPHPLVAPPPPIQRRPLHLAKSVLLI
jgi:hypothetical protein